MDTVITVDRLRKSYRQVTAVDDISLSVTQGEIFGILGPNGAGKTTAVECIQGLRGRDSGHVEVLGIDPATEPTRLRRRIGSQLQSAAVPDRLHVDEAIRLFARLGESVDVEAALAEWDLVGVRHRPYATLSGGQRQRLFLALALLGAPEVLFLDELTAALDPDARRATWRLVREVRDRGATVVLVTHFMEEAEALCDRVAIVDRGTVVALDTPAALVAAHGRSVRTTFTINGHDAHFLRTLPGIQSVDAARSGRVAVSGVPTTPVTVAAALAERGIVPRDFRTHHPSLEDVFLQLTGRTLTAQEPT